MYLKHYIPFQTLYNIRNHCTQRHATPRHATPRHATPRHATPRHATPRHATPRHATPRHATPRHATQRNATQRNATQRNATQRNATQRNKSWENVYGVWDITGFVDDTAPACICIRFPLNSALLCVQNTHVADKWRWDIFLNTFRQGINMFLPNYSYWLDYRLVGNGNMPP